MTIPNPTEAPMANAINDVKLSPCPFCGSRNVAQGASRDQISVWCFCGAQGPSVPFPEINPEPIKAIHECFAAWNRRASPAPSQHTGWSDEAVEAFLIASSVAAGDTRECIRAGLTAAALSAASSIAPATGFEVKDLQWSTWGPNRHSAQSMGASYSIRAGGAADDGLFDLEINSYTAKKGGFSTLGEAKGFAQADFDSRIRSSISPSVAKESGEPS